MPGQTITVALAEEYSKEYVAYMEGLGVNMEEQTQSVSFTGETFQNWVDDVMPFSDEIRIFMGRYANGRTSVVLWAYSGGQPAMDGPTVLEPYNDGSGNP